MQEKQDLSGMKIDFDFSKLFDKGFSDLFAETIRPSSAPVNFKKIEGYTRLEFEVPGYTKKDIEIGFKDGILSVTGKKALENEEDYESIQFRPREFSTKVNVKTDVVPEEILAKVENGILMIDIPKAELKNQFNIKVS